MKAADFIAFLEREARAMRVEITRVRGSSPREEGAVMVVWPTAMVGTIGGGQLEYMALDEARKLLKLSQPSGFMDVPLGPEIGQCCGGRVEITLTEMDSVLASGFADGSAVVEVPALLLAGPAMPRGATRTRVKSVPPTLTVPTSSPLGSSVVMLPPAIHASTS